MPRISLVLIKASKIPQILILQYHPPHVPKGYWQWLL